MAIKVCTKNRSSDYTYLSDHLNLTNLPLLPTIRLTSNSPLYFKIFNGSFVYPNAPLVRRNLFLNLRSSKNIQFKRLICHTNAYTNYFPSYYIHFGTTYKIIYRVVLRYYLLNVVLYIPLYLCKTSTVIEFILI